MNIFRVKEEPPTDIDFAAVADTGQLYAEKPAATEPEGVVQRHQHHVDPTLEARVVRKMDLRLVPLVMTLCMQFKSHNFKSSPTIPRSARIPRSFQHRASHASGYPLK